MKCLAFAVLLLFSCFAFSALHAQCSADFDVSDYTPCGGQVDTFFLLNPTPGFTYIWDFGDNTTAAGASVTHVYPPGPVSQAYVVTVTGTDTDGNSCSLSQVVTVLSTPEVTLTDTGYDPVAGGEPFTNCDATPDNPNYELSILVSSPNSNIIEEVVLDWGDTSQLVTIPAADLPLSLDHTYTSRGFFLLTVSASPSGVNCDYVQTIEVFNGSNPAVGLGNPGSTVGICAPVQLSFPITGTENNAPGTIYEVYINGELGPVFNHPPPAAVDYTFLDSSCGEGTSDGTYQNAIDVRIVARNPCFSTDAIVQPITVGTAPSADFTVQPEGGACEGDIVTFSNNSMGGTFITNQNCNEAVNLQWTITPASGWTLESGNLQGNSLDEANQIGVLFQETGVYQVELRVANPCGQDILTETIEIIDPPTALATGPDRACAPATLAFANLSGNNLTNEWTVTPVTGWAFADGTVPDSENPSFQFVVPGTYTVALEVTNSCGSDQWDTTVVIQGLPLVAIDPIPDFCETAEFTPAAAIDENGCAVQSCLWTFEGGSPATITGCDPGPVIFTTPGEHEVLLTVTNCCGVTTDTLSFFIEEPITGIDAGPPLDLCADGDCLILDSLGIPENGTWTDQANTVITEFCPTAAGAFRLFYSVGTGLCQAIDSMDITVNPLPVISITNAPDLLCADDAPILLTASPSGGSWTGVGVTETGLFDPSLAGVGNHVLTYAFEDDVTACRNTDSVTIEVAGLADLDLPPVTFCLTSEDLDLEAYFGIDETGGSGTWTGPGIFDADEGLFNPFFAAGGNTGGDTSVTVVYTFVTSEGCVSSDSSLLTLIPLTAADAGPDQTVCIADDSLQLMPNLTGNWYGEGVDSTGLIDLSMAGGGASDFYFVAFEGSSCESRDTVTITVVDLSEVNAGSDLYVCESSEDLLLSDALIPPGASGTWSGPAVVNSVAGLVDVGQLAADSSYIFTLQVVSNVLPECMDTSQRVLTVAPLPVVSFEVEGNLCADTLLNFLNTSEGGEAFIWAFINGDTSTEMNADYDFDLPGTYLVTLTGQTFNPLGELLCESSVSQNLTIGQEPALVAFTADTDAGCGDLEVNLTNNSIGDDLNFEWYLDTTLISTATTPGPLLLPPGRADTLYALRLEVANGCGNNADELEVTVFPPPVPRFGTDFNEYCSGDTVYLSNVSYGNVDNYFWIFGGNNPSSTDSIPPPALYFTDDGAVQPITLIVSNECGTDTLTQTVTINPTNVNAFFNTDQTEVCVGDTVCFTNFSTATAEVEYQFGDGNSTTVANPCHTYQSPGLYTVVQRAYACGFDSTTAMIEVRPLPVVGFTHVPVVCTGAAVAFSNTTAGAVDYEWLFGDSTGSILTSPVHPFTAPGVYDISLAATNDLGCTATTVSQVTVLAPPVADFMYTDSVCAGATVGFTSTSMGQALSCSWEFGDTTTSASCVTAHLYEASGQYPVTLVVTDVSGCRDTSSQLLYVRSVPDPAFTVDLDGSCSPVTATFTNTSIDATSYLWDFGDTLTSMATSPVHVFETGGTFTVSLTAGNEGICSAVVTQEVVIRQTPEAAFEAGDPEGCAPAVFTFTNNSEGPVTDYFWDFGDSLTSFEEAPVHTYLEPGTYPVTLIVSSPFCADTLSSEVLTVYVPVTAAYDVTDLVCAGDQNGAIDLTVSSGTAPFAYNWSDGSATQDLQGLGAGTYRLTITDANGCRWLDTLLVEEPPPLMLNVVEERIVTCYDGNDGGLTLQVEGGTPGYDYQWSNQVAGPVISDVPAGTYSVTITDASGCELVRSYLVTQNSPLTVRDSMSAITCFGYDDGVISLDSIFGSTPPYRWELAGPEGVLPFSRRYGNLPAGVYELTVEDDNGCLLQRDYTLTEPAPVWVDILAEEETILLGDSVRLTTAYNAVEPYFTWTPPDWLDCDFCAAPVARPERSVTYQVRMVDRYGCVAADSVRLEVRPARAVYVPNAFSPDGDGYNDVFMVRSGDPGLRTIREFRVFDRWGALMFTATDGRPNDPDYGWDGRGRNGVDLQPGVFTWFAVIEFVDGEVKEYAGEVLLIR